METVAVLGHAHMRTGRGLGAREERRVVGGILGVYAAMTEKQRRSAGARRAGGTRTARGRNPTRSCRDVENPVLDRIPAVALGERTMDK